MLRTFFSLFKHKQEPKSLLEPVENNTEPAKKSGFRPLSTIFSALHTFEWHLKRKIKQLHTRVTDKSGTILNRYAVANRQDFSQLNKRVSDLAHQIDQLALHRGVDEVSLERRKLNRRGESYDETPTILKSSDFKSREKRISRRRRATDTKQPVRT